MSQEIFEVVSKLGESPETDLGFVASLDGAPEWIADLALWVDSPSFVIFLVVITIWSSIWKGIALWKAGRHGQLRWFVWLFLLNTAGILEVLYLKFWQKGKKAKKTK
jgi:hypothetical protein